MRLLGLGLGLGVRLLRVLRRHLALEVVLVKLAPLVDRHLVAVVEVSDVVILAHSRTLLKDGNALVGERRQRKASRHHALADAVRVHGQVVELGLVEELDCERRVVLAGPLALHAGGHPDDVGELDLHVADVHPLVLHAELDRRFVHMGALVDHAGHHREQVRVELLVVVVPARVGHMRLVLWVRERRLLLGHDRARLRVVAGRIDGAAQAAAQWRLLRDLHRDALSHLERVEQLLVDDKALDTGSMKNHEHVAEHLLRDDFLEHRQVDVAPRPRVQPIHHVLPPAPKGHHCLRKARAALLGCHPREWVDLDPLDETALELAV